MQKIDQPISWDELKVAVTNLTNDKAPGLNKVRPNYFKAINGDNLTRLPDLLDNYCLEKTDFDE